MECPDDEIFSDYIEGRLMGRERLKIEEHLYGCNICRDCFIIAGKLVKDRDQSALNQVPAKVTLSAISLLGNLDRKPKNFLPARLKTSFEWITRHISDVMVLSPTTRAHPTTVRSSGQIIVSKKSICIKRALKEIDAEIKIEKTGKNSFRVRITFFKQTRYRNIRVTLKENEREIYSSLLNRDNLLFEEIPCGHYSISFFMEGRKIKKYFFEIKELLDE